MKDIKEYEEFVKEQEDLYQSMKDDLDKIMWLFKRTSLESDIESAINIKDLAKEFISNSAIVYSNIIRYVDITSMTDESSLDQYLEDDDPEGFMNEWGDYKRTPVDGKMVLYAVPGESKIVNIDKDKKSEEAKEEVEGENMNNTEDIEIDMKLVDTPIPGPSFHGESWYRCPKCKIGFEYFDTKFERGFVHIKGKIYKHTQNDCNQLIDMS